jgi:predicted metal-dependent HD superfamily phosphohydrolase
VTTPSHLRRAWLNLLSLYDASPEAAEWAFAELARRYSEPHRHYHTLDHIAAMLGLLPRPSPPLALAVWFHDAVYDTHAADNEERSATLADEMLQPLYIPADVRAETRRLIQLTKRHEAAADDAEGKQLLDADLAILGAPPDEYDRYAAAIRREYVWVAEDDYRRGRRNVLENFLRRERLYFTEEMRERREAQARENMRREIAALG